eukprot:10379583-Alexandrium_andersonii.AAC.1
MCRSGLLLDTTWGLPRGQRLSSSTCLRRTRPSSPGARAPWSARGQRTAPGPRQQASWAPPWRMPRQRTVRH